MEKARTVYCTLNQKLQVLSTKDPVYTKRWLGYLDHEIDYTGTHYGWPLGEILEAGATMRHDIHPTFNHACMNKRDDKTHHNTIAPRPWELVKLDVGYWGAYWRNNKSGDHNFSRDFGLVQGQDVYLCRFHSQCGEALQKKFWADIDALPIHPGGRDTAIQHLLKSLKAMGFAVELRLHAVIQASALTERLNPDALSVFFPDLHLPERLPDQPASKRDDRIGQVAHVHPDAASRAKLQARLIASQHKPGWAEFSTLSTPDQDAIQSHLENLIVNGATQPYTFIEKRRVLSDLTYTFTREQFLAELAHVERRIRAASSWFYEPSPGFKPPDTSGRFTLGDLTTTDDTELDPLPAIDLINLLLAIRELQANAEYVVHVYQAGDLFELWMGREFLYFDFPTIDEPLGAQARQLLGILSSHESVGHMLNEGVNDEFQYRMDAGWRKSAAADISTGFKRLVFNQIRQELLLQRHKTGWDFDRDGTLRSDAFYEAIGGRWVENHSSDACYAATVSTMTHKTIGEGVIGRLQALLRQRCQNVINHCLPVRDATGHSWTKLLERGFINAYARPDAGISDDEFAWSAAGRIKRTEYHFSRAIVDLLGQLGTQDIHGNHDGYRSDPIFTGHVLGHVAAEYLGDRGMWMEHSHRYDRFNRDGRALGAGVTNLVYYFMSHVLSLDTTKDNWAGWLGLPHSQERTCFQPGAAQWFATVNLADRGDAFQYSVDGRRVEPFGLYVGGHTHGPDLVRIHFCEPS